MGRHPKYFDDLGDPERHPIRAQIRAALQDDRRPVREIARQAIIPAHRLYHFLSDVGDLELVEVDRLARTMGFTLTWVDKPPQGPKKRTRPAQVDSGLASPRIP